MVYILPNSKPHRSSSLTYLHAYEDILRARRQSPHTSASSVILLVPPQLDALCAAHMLATLFTQDEVLYRIIPVAGYPSLQQVRSDLLKCHELHTLVLFNIGSVLDISSPEWFGQFSDNVTVHIIDAARPYELRNLFGTTESGHHRVVVWDDGHAEMLTKEREAFDAIEYSLDDDTDESDLDSEGSPSESLDGGEETESGEDEGYESGSRKRRRAETDFGGSGAKRRRRRADGDASLSNLRLPRARRSEYRDIIRKHYNSGVHHGQSAAGVIYLLTTVLERADNDLLWLAILGLTQQYITSSITRAQYEKYHEMFSDEVARLNPPAASSTSSDRAVRQSEELRFSLLRHWNLFDAMMHCGYVANKLGVWKDEGKKKIQRMLTKMGFSLTQSTQSYSYMDLNLRESLHDQLSALAPEVGLLELTYPSFTKPFPDLGLPRLAAADVVAGVEALLEAATGVRIAVEVEGGRGGGELFGGVRVWEMKRLGARGKGKENMLSDRQRSESERHGKHMSDQEVEEGEPGEDLAQAEKSWVHNFWIAFDALGESASYLPTSLSLAIALQQAILRQGCSILAKKSIQTFRTFRLVMIKEGPDLALFAHPGTLTRLTIWLVEATRDRMPTLSTVRSGGKGKGLPFVVCCLDEKAGSYIIVGITGAPEFGDIRKNHFGVAFLNAKGRSHARTRHSTFDTSVLEINKDDLKGFIEALAMA